MKLSIGMPVYNGERFLKNRLDSILSQTFGDFELIISDNASNDKTEKICKEYLQRDSRIKYFRQEKNIGVKKNFEYVLDKALKKYFVWASVDDKWEPEFLMANINFLESNKDYVASISKVSRFGGDEEKFAYTQNDFFWNKFYKQFRRRFRKYGVWSTSGNYQDRSRIYLRSSSGQALYSVFRTIEIKKSMVKEKISGLDLAIILNVLKYGNINVLENNLIHFFWEGLSRKGIKSTRENFSEINKLTLLFPQLDFAKWCLDNLGKKIFISNLDYFVFVNLWSFVISIKGYLKN